MSYKNNIIKLHRWFGLSLSIIMVIWFLSGIVMIYKTFPHFTTEEKYQNYQELNKEDLIKHKDLINELTKGSSKIEFYKIMKRPVCTTENIDGLSKRYFLDTGKEIKNIDSSLAYQIASSTFNLNNAQFNFELVNSLDTWIPWERMVKHFPIYKFNFNDKESTQLYVSSKTGEILQHSTYSDRFWACFGAIPHWFYFKDLRRHLETWRWVIVIISGIGSFMCLFGLLTGVYRGWKKKRGKIKLSPYSVSLYRWHHYLGFAFGLITLTWVFSGMMSLVPDRWFYDNKQEINLLEKNNQKTEIDSTINYVAIFSYLDSIKTEIKNITIKNINVEERIELKSSVSESYLFSNQKIYDRSSKFVLDAGIERFNELYKNEIESIIVLNEYDNYYYTKSSKNLALPVLKLELNNDLNTHLYINPINYEILRKTNSYSRIRRWLYKGLHCLDFSIIYISVLWEPIIIILMVGGTLLSITGSMFIFRRMKKKKK